MKSNILRFTAALLLILGAVSVHAQVPPTSAPPEAPPATNPPVTDAKAGTAAAPANAADRAFLDEAHASGMKEVQAAQLAKSRTSDKDVRELADLIERDHRSLNGKLVAAGARDVQAVSSPVGTPPAPGDESLPAADAPRSAAADVEGGPTGSTALLANDPHMKGLLSARGEAFDLAYLEMLVRMHEKSIAKFESVADGQAHSASVQSLAQGALPALRRHASMASSLKDAIEND